MQTCDYRYGIFLLWFILSVMEGLLKSNKLVPMWPMFWDLIEGGEM